MAETYLMKTEKGGDIVFRKSLAVGVVLGFLLAGLVFAVLPVGSQTQRQYDPWADVNDDGIINMRDVTYEILLFNTVGDPAKPVIVSRHEAYWEVKEFTVTSAGYYYSANVTGLERLTITVKVRGTAQVSFCWYWGSPMPPLAETNVTVVNSEANYMWTSEIKAPYFYVYYAPVQGVINCYTVIAIYITA
jgi:hypothetical protein